MYPTIFSWGAVRIHSYGLMVAVGVFLAISFLRRSARKIHVDPNQIVDLALVTLLAGFVGARVFYVTQFWQYFRSVPIDILKLWQGGIVLYGGLVGGFLGFWIFIKVHRLSFLSLLDLFIPAVALAQGFGRLGCFLNGCCFGTRTTLPWGVLFPFLEYRVHPTQLYESFFCFLLFGFLLILWYKRSSSTPGIVSSTYFILYPIGRFFLEFLRGDNSKLFLNLTLAQWISFVILLFALPLLVFFISHGRKVSRRAS